jgi:hypothetical protein
MTPTFPESAWRIAAKHFRSNGDAHFIKVLTYIGVGVGINVAIAGDNRTNISGCAVYSSDCCLLICPPIFIRWLFPKLYLPYSELSFYKNNRYFLNEEVVFTTSTFPYLFLYLPSSLKPVLLEHDVAVH